MTLPEQWRPIPGYEGHYEASDQGQVRSVSRVIVCRNGQRQRRAGRLIRPFITPNGRRTVHLCRDAKSSPRTVYALILEAFVGPAPEGHEACHANGDAKDDRLANLRWDTKSANTLDMVRHGTHHVARRTHCPRGHVLSEPNIVPSFWRLRHERACLACWRAKCNRYEARKRGGDIDFVAAADRHYARIMEEADRAVHDAPDRQAGQSPRVGADRAARVSGVGRSLRGAQRAAD